MPPDAALQAALGLELFLDLALGALLAVAVLSCHAVIREKMDLKREAAAKGGAAAAKAKRAGSDSGDEAPQAVPIGGAAGATSPERRLTAKASSRRRMAAA